MSPELIFLGSLCLFVIVVLGLIVLSFFQGLRNFEEVLAHGIETDATVERKFRRKNARFYVQLSYYDLTGRRHQSTKRVLPSEFHQLQENGSVKIVYSLKNPQIFSFYEDVARARELRKQQPN